MSAAVETFEVRKTTWLGSLAQFRSTVTVAACTTEAAALAALRLLNGPPQERAAYSMWHHRSFDAALAAATLPSEPRT